VIEQTAMRTQDVLGLTWGDVDVAGARFRLPRQRTKTHRPRWIQVPEWLVELVAATCPAEDRTPERRVFQGLSEKTLYHAVGGACRAAEIAHYHPHDLRHRRISLWHGQGIPAKEIAERSGSSVTTAKCPPVTSFPLCSGRPIAASDPRRAPQHSAGWPLPHEPALALTRLTWEA
jgi:integrase